MCAIKTKIINSDRNDSESTRQPAIMVDTYKAILVHFMSYVSGHAYDKDYEFSQEELGALNPMDVKKYMCMKAYGTAEPNRDDHPLFARSSTLMFWKKAISFYMPNKLMAWNAIAQVGNPTRSVEVNELIKTVKKQEVRKQGKLSTARRAITHPKFLRMLDYLKEDEDAMRKYGLPSLFVFQYNLIARIDDTCQFLVSNLTASSDFDFVLRSRLNWSKNVHEERDAPNQILLGAIDFRYCVLLTLAIHLEVFLGTEGGQGGLSPYVFGFSDDITVPDGGSKTKDKIQAILHNEIFCHEEFHDGVGGLLGSHSNRKLASTHAMKNGCRREEKDLRGRWKRRKHVSNVYDDVDLPYPDAKVAGRLCVGGPCKYVVKEGSGVTDNFLLENVVPNVRTRYADDVAKVLGKALLWLIFSSDSDYLPQALRDCVRTAYDNIAQLPAGENPVKKLQLLSQAMKENCTWMKWEKIWVVQKMALDVVIKGKSTREKNCWRSNHRLLDYAKQLTI